MADKRNYVSRTKYMILAVAKRRRKIRDLAVQYKGGKCQICGYNKCPQALEFHHLSPNGKDFGISDKGYTRSWTRVQKEIDKCILVCANCHREIHAGITQLPKEILECPSRDNGEAPMG